MAVGTEKCKIFETVVRIHSVNMLELKHDFLFVPHQYTIVRCEILVLACGTLVNPIKITYKSFLNCSAVPTTTVDHKNFV
jgi:hypothetical protein